MTTRRAVSLGLLAALGAGRAMSQPVAAAPRQIASLADPLLIEGIAYWNGRTFVSSVLERRILELRSDGTLAPFAGDGLLGVFGMAVDWDGSRLFAATASLARGGGSELVAVSLETGQVMRRWAARSPAKLGDVVIGPNNAVYASDSAGGSVWALNLVDNQFTPLLPGGSLRSAQGLAISPSQTVLAVADYAAGLVRYDLSSGEPARIEAPEGQSLSGIDGLCEWQGKLIATQNGRQPNQVLLLTLDEGWTRVGEVRVIAQGDAVVEPTLGVAVEGAISSSRDHYLFIGKSQWGSLGEDQHLRPGFGPTVIQSIPLEPLR